MKVVVDTNVFVRALFFNDKWSKKVIQEEKNGDLIFVMSADTQRELCNTLIAIAISKGCNLEEFRKPYMLLSNCLARSELVNPKKNFNLSKHNSDNKFIDCAVAGGCRYIITEDEDLLSLGNINPTGKKTNLIKILSPYQFFIELNALKLKAKYR